MVTVVLRGMERSPHPKTFLIAHFKAGVALRQDGGIFLTVTDIKLAKKLAKAFWNMEIGRAHV